MTFIKECKTKINNFTNKEKIELALNRKIIQQYLCTYVKISSLSLTIAMAFIIILVNTLIPSLKDLSVPYFFALVIGAIFNILTFSLLKKYPDFSLLTYYLFFTLVLLCSIFVIVYIDDLVTSPIMYCLAILVFASFAIDKSKNVFGYIILTTILSSFATFFLGHHTIYTLHSIISISATSLIAFMFALSVRRTILKMLETERITKLERNLDSLTTLPNRRTLFEAIIDAENNKTMPYTGAIMLDIDHFKIFNDTNGHQKGDNVLKQIGCFLKDFAMDFGFSAFRYGGEEFLLLSDKYNEKQLKQFANRIVESVEMLKIPFADSPQKVVTFSAGYASKSNKNKASYEKLISNADAALYYSKETGRNKASGFKEIPVVETQRKSSLRNTDRELSENESPRGM